jgi:hypothetical protein
MNIIKNHDLLIGEMEEELFKILIKENFNMDIEKTDNFHCMDYYNDDTYFELKSRSFNHNKYPTTMIGQNKIAFARDTDKQCVFVFSFKDGYYYYVFDRSDWFETKIGGRNDRGKPEYKNYVYIPITKLKKLI